MTSSANCAIKIEAEKGCNPNPPLATTDLTRRSTMVIRTHTTVLSAFAILAALNHAHAEKLGDFLCKDVQSSGCVEVSPELVLAMDLDLSKTGDAMNGRQAVAVAGVTALMAILASANQAQRPAQVAALETPVFPQGTVFIGDSIFAGLGSPPGVVNLAVGGTTTTQILASVALIPSSAKEVFVEGGINDPNSALTISNYAKILAAIPGGIQERVVGILPVTNDTLATHTAAHPVSNAEIAATDAAIAKLCTGRCSVVAPPFPSPMPTALNVGDGIHPNAAGKTVLLKALH